MSMPQPVKKKNWPRFALSPEGNRARFDCAGDVPPSWTLEFPLPTSPPKTEAFKASGSYVTAPPTVSIVLARADAAEEIPATPKKRGRPKKQAAE